MKSSTKWCVFIEVFLACMAITSIFLMLQEKNTKKQKEIAILVENSDEEQWTAFKYGAEMAAQDNMVKVSVVSMGQISNAKEQRQLIEREIKEGVDAIIMQPVEGKETDNMLKNLEEKIPILLVGSSVSKKEPAQAVVAPDNYEIGKSIASEIVKDYNGTIKGKKVGIYESNPESLEVYERKKGLKAGLKKSEVQFVWDYAVNTNQDLIQNKQEADIIVALDNKSVVLVGEFSKNYSHNKARIYGVGNSMKAIYYLDTDAVESLIVPDEFSIGYKSVEIISNKLSDSLGKMKSESVSFTKIRKETLYNKKNQELLFIMNQ